jgi:hypothetical protein
MAAQKSIRKVLPAPRSHWVGDGFHVYPVFSNLAFTNELSPFLMFDYGAPKQFKPTKSQLGVGQHPHRGFETVTGAQNVTPHLGDMVQILHLLRVLIPTSTFLLQWLFRVKSNTVIALETVM